MSKKFVTLAGAYNDRSMQSRRFWLVNSKILLNYLRLISLLERKKRAAKGTN